MLENVTEFVEMSTRCDATAENIDSDYCPKTITLLANTLASASLPMESDVLMELVIVRWVKG